jgi:hypothetical protein
MPGPAATAFQYGGEFEGCGNYTTRFPQKRGGHCASPTIGEAKRSPAAMKLAARLAKLALRNSIR